jgi:hypothetical protein
LSPAERRDSAAGNLRFISQLGSYAPGEYIRGYERHEVSQLQFTFTKVFGPGQLARCRPDRPGGEIRIHQGVGPAGHSTCSLQGRRHRYRWRSGLLTGALRNPLTCANGFPTQFSWGYRLAARADYNNVFGSRSTCRRASRSTMTSTASRPGPGGNFLEGRKSVTIGVEANYLNEWSFDLSYTASWGGNLQPDPRPRLLRSPPSIRSEATRERPHDKAGSRLVGAALLACQFERWRKVAAVDQADQARLGKDLTPMGRRRPATPMAPFRPGSGGITTTAGHTRSA